MSDQSDMFLDARGLLCPLPVLKVKKRLRGLERQARLILLTDDPAAIIDIPHFCHESGTILEAQTSEGEDVMRWVLRKP